MYKLILVDDEEIALKGLANYVDWGAMHFEVVGTACTIAQALQLVRSTPVDVVLTDIQLEEESGLTLIRILSEEYKSIRCVVLSGHGEFDYARQALRYGTFDFLTKPVQFDALKQTFGSLYLQLENDAQEEGQKREYLELKRNTFFNNLAKEKSRRFDLATAQELKIQPSGNLRLARICVDEHVLQGAVLEGAKAMLCRLCARLFASNVQYELFNNTLNEYAVIFYNCESAPYLSLLEALIAECDFKISIGISRLFCSWDLLFQAYSEAGKALDYRLIQSDQSIILFESVQNILYDGHIVSEQMAVELNDCLAQKDIKKLFELTDTNLRALYRNGDSLHFLYSYCIEVQFLFDRFLRSYLPSYTESEALGFIREAVLYTTVDDLAHYMHRCIESIQPLILSSNPYSNDVVQKVQNYIQEHYAEDITLQKLADQFFLHPIYLSKLFKEKSGKNFIDYITCIRVENAKKLLRETSLRIYDISQMIGYESPKYFSKVFRDESGLTPSEYREDFSKGVTGNER